MTQFANGYCYLRLFVAYNASVGREFYDLEIVKSRMGRYPLIRRVIGDLYAFSTSDFYIPYIRAVSPNLYHVFLNGQFLKFSEVITDLLFSDARIGGITDNDNAVIRVNQGVATFANLCEIGGIDLNVAMAEASKKQLAEMIKEPTSEIKHMFKPLLNGFEKKKNKFVVNYALSAKQIALLQRSFPELNVVVTGKTYHPHSMAAVTRDCAEAHILKLLSYTPTSRSLIGGKDVYLIDIGANYVRHIRKNRFNIHCCNPLIDYRDCGRDMEREQKLRDMISKKEISRKTYEDYAMGKSTIRRCYNLVECCGVKAECGMLIHSQYDIGMKELALAFDAHEFNIVWSVLLFDQQVFYKDEGLIEDVNAKFERKKGKIYFSFVGDPSLNYCHDYNSYIHLLTQQILVTPKGRVYIIERTNTRCGNLFAKFVLCHRAPMYDTIELNFKYWNDNLDLVVIATWEYKDSYFSESKFKTLTSPIVSFKRRFFEIDRRFRDLLYGHCLRSGNKSFNLNDVFSAALTFNTRMSINAINNNDIRAVNRVPSTDLLSAVVAIYCIAYRDR